MFPLLVLLVATEHFHHVGIRHQTADTINTTCSTRLEVLSSSLMLHFLLQQAKLSGFWFKTSINNFIKSGPLTLSFTELPEVRKKLRVLMCSYSDNYPVWPCSLCHTVKLTQTDGGALLQAASGNGAIMGF